MPRKAKSENKPVVRPTSLDALNLKVIHIEIERPEDSEILLIDLAPLTFREWEQVGQLVKDPQPPSIGTADGIKYDWQNYDFRQAIIRTVQERMVLRLTRAIEKAGQFTLEGTTLQDKANYLLDHLDSQIVFGLLSEMEKMHSERMAQVKSRAEMFRHNGKRGDVAAPGDLENLPDVGQEP